MSTKCRDFIPTAGTSFIMAIPETALEGRVFLAREPSPDGTVPPADTSARYSISVPLSGVKVTAGDVSTTTDISGHWKIPDLKPGACFLTAEKQNFTIFRKQVTVEKDQVITVTISLTPQNYEQRQQNPQ